MESDLGVITQRIAGFVQHFATFESWEQKYKYLMELGRKMPSLSSEQKQEKFLIKGCQSQVWLLAKMEEGKVIYQADSDGAITKGLVALLLAIYSDATPAAILATPASFLEELGIKNHLSLNRANGLNSMVKQLMLYAMVLRLPH